MTQSSANQTIHHIPVLCNEVIDMLAIKKNGLYIDATLGAGGMARAILAKQPKKLLGMDRDPVAINMAGILQEKYQNLQMMNMNYADMDHVLCDYHSKVDGIVFDLGVSAMQLDDAKRGFSFGKTATLDMRMNQSESIPTACDIINQKSQTELADIFYRYGEEKKSRLLAKKIIEYRRHTPITTTSELSQLVVASLGYSKNHPATRVFQALRIFVNNELGGLLAGLSAAMKLLASGGRLVVISFHSLEDKIVKDVFKKHSGRSSGVSRHTPSYRQTPMLPPFTLLTKKPITPTNHEMLHNPRSRSAKLRAIMKSENTHQ
ncbi:MAG: 16S rRNA (cytosine(1402)-N(4))-methyltransferase RsmH [Alphaproteobacteria bacterium]